MRHAPPTTTTRTLAHWRRLARRALAHAVQQDQRWSALRAADRPTLLMWTATVALGLLTLPALAAPTGSARGWLLLATALAITAPAFAWWLRGLYGDNAAEIRSRRAALARLEALRGALGDDHPLEIAQRANGEVALTLHLSGGALTAALPPDNAAPARLSWRPDPGSPTSPLPARLERASHVGAWRLGAARMVDGQIQWNAEAPAWMKARGPEAHDSLLRQTLGLVDPTLDPFEGEGAARRIATGPVESPRATVIPPVAAIAIGATLALSAATAGLALGLRHFGHEAVAGLTPAPLMWEALPVALTISGVGATVALIAAAVSLNIARRERAAAAPPRDQALWIDGLGARLEIGEGSAAGEIAWGRPFQSDLWRVGEPGAGIARAALELRQEGCRIVVGADLPEAALPASARRLDLDHLVVDAATFVEIQSLVERAHQLS